MSRPPNNQGHFPGQPVQYPHSAAATPNVQPASSFYAAPHVPSPATVANNYASLNGSFEYNGSKIPGLGMSFGPAAPVLSSPYQFGSKPTTTHPQYEGKKPAAQSFTPKARSLEQERVSQPINVPPVPTQSNDASEEEGELSEGEFEDLYEPKSAPVAPGQTPQAPAPGANNQNTGSPGDADGSSIYATGSTQEDMVIDSTSASQPGFDEDDDYEPGEYEPEYHPRDKSGSYSPRLSPKEAKSATVPAAANGHVAPPSDGNKSQPLSSATSAPVPATPSLPYTSVAEAKKKAQEAILGLWPLKVRYQNYLDEGLSPEVVKSLFTELGLDTSSPKPASVPTPAQLSTTSTAQPTTLLDQSKPAPTEVTMTAPKAEQKKSAQEERKDKIARMLAEKSKKNATLPPPTAAASLPVRPSASAATTPSDPDDAAKVKLRAQNNQRLLEKLAALKKQQTPKPESAPPIAPSVTATQPERQANPLGNAAEVKHSVHPSPSNGERVASPASGGHGLSVSSSPHPTSRSRNTKRPVASDFDSYSSNSNALKRTRTQETLIIDVSDDEDVEMDLGSPTEPSASAIQDSNGPRPNALASFPPLTHSRSWHGPKSNSATPAAGTPAGHGQKLDQLTLRIQEARRRIAEAEAKKASRSNGEPTPLTQSPANTPGPQEPALFPKPPQAPQAPHSPHVERRDRITNYDIPVLDAALREKQERLRRLQEEAAQLEMEVKATMDARQQLAVEMASFATTTASSPRLDGPSDVPLQTVSNEAAPVSEESAKPEAADLSTGEVDTKAVSEKSTGDKEIEVSSPNNTSMDIESDSASSGLVSTMEDTAADVASHVEVPLVVASASETMPAESHTQDESVLASDNGQKDVELQDQPAATLVGDVLQEPSSPDPDVPMQISDVEDEVDDDAYEPQPSHISDTVQAYGPSGTGDEIPDEEPYEPNPSPAVAEPAAQTSSDATIGKVQARSSQEPPSLTTEQARFQDGFSTEDLLSYQSPLRYFQAYKFHPQYVENVAGGWKSMTYNSKIDVSRPICPFVLNDGQCPNGASCEFQHFDKMALSDSAIIAQIGSATTYTGEQRDRFIEGLKKVLQDLKAHKIKDFESITKALVQYRADFLGDKSKVLPLNDVVI
ncbi:hypothetical protein KJ359_009445 [Pestalotiopsis sp. 9143b]|nr:hypothetical protein KJ359_009445 [Pestalotiopsis sp. 9143b]